MKYQRIKTQTKTNIAVILFTIIIAVSVLSVMSVASIVLVQNIRGAEKSTKFNTSKIPTTESEVGQSYDIILDDEGTRRLSDVIWNGAVYFVVWDDFRRGTDFHDSDVYGARILPDGTILDPDGIPISTIQNRFEGGGSVAWNGENFFVSWTDYRDYTPETEKSDIYATRISSNGTVLDPEGIRISQGPHFQIGTDVASNGEIFFVVWFGNNEENQGGGNWDIFGRRINNNGVMLDESDLALSLAYHQQDSPLITTHDLLFFVIWSDHRDKLEHIYGTRVSFNGEVMDPEGVPIAVAESGRAAHASLATGEEFSMVVWSDSRLPGRKDNQLFANRLDAQGIPLDEGGKIILPFYKEEEQVTPHIVGFQKNFFLTWQSVFLDDDDSQFISATIIDPKRKKLMGCPLKISNTGERPMAAYDGTRFLVLWRDNGIYGKFLEPGDLPTTPQQGSCRTIQNTESK